MSINWVMLRQEGGIVPMPNERILYTSKPRVGLDILTPQQLQVAEPFSVKSSNGVAYVTNQRVIYLPAVPTEQFKSFAAPILSWEDTYIRSSFLGPWTWGGIVKPVTGGGIPMHIPRIEARLAFKEGGHSDFQLKFETIKERLYHARELMAATGQQNLPDEDLPPYEADAPPGSTQRPAADQPQAPAAEAPANSTRTPQPPQPGPNEPPPDYVEAQAAALSNQYEERVREEAEHGDGET
ncbi:hypothetical protein GQ53DRAFT_497740 [Thozetella sp. PMI_491]|nr:hypothetical protein GQ53DRAFT_497740 [Thozetella sp. PMI_491]